MPTVLTKDGAIEERENQTYATRETCRACFAKTLTSVIDFGVQYLPRFPEAIDHSLPAAPLHLVRCGSCGLLQLEHTVKPELLYKNYWYRSSINQTMRTQLDDLIEFASQYHKRGAWLDIGANDGYLLSRVSEKFEKTAVEPSDDFQGPLNAVADHVVHGYFSADKVAGKYDVITSAAMFYDLDDPTLFVRDIAKSLSPEGVWVNQLNDAPTMLKKMAFDGICHEHLTYYDVHALDQMYRQEGLTITRVSFNDTNGGSVRVVGRKSTRQREDMLGIPRTKQEDVDSFVRRTKKWKERMLDLCHGPLSQGKTYAYGASTKGTMMLQYLEAACFKAVADRNPLKYGKRMVGSWLPVVSEEEMREDHPKHVVVLPWGLARDEFLRREAKTIEAGTTFVMPLPNIEFIL